MRNALTCPRAWHVQLLEKTLRSGCQAVMLAFGERFDDVQIHMLTVELTR